jgi:hypothetical protein
VVLEWFNPACPFVVKHYGASNMQGLQKRLTGEDVVWIAVNSTAADHPEYLQPAKTAEWMQQQKAAPSRVVLDPTGTIGRATAQRRLVERDQNKPVVAFGLAHAVVAPRPRRVAPHISEIEPDGHAARVRLQALRFS